MRMGRQIKIAGVNAKCIKNVQPETGDEVLIEVKSSYGSAQQQVDIPVCLLILVCCRRGGIPDFERSDTRILCALSS
jgi:hypothetical protein